MGRATTATFARAWGSAQAARVILMKVEFANPSPLTLYLSDQAGCYFQGILWQQAITGEVTVTERSPYLSPGPDLATAEVTLENREVSDASGELTASLALLQWQGATVTLYRHERSLATPMVYSTGGWFEGRVNRPVLDNGKIRLPLMQGRVWNRRVPTKALDKINYPNAPDVGTGKVIPVVYGSFVALPMRAPWATAYGSLQAFEDLGNGSGAVPGVLTDPGYGSNNVRATFAEHAVKSLNNNRTGGLTQFIVGGNQLDPLSGATTFSLAGDSYMEIDDDELFASHGVVPTDIYTAASTAAPNTATNPRNCMDLVDETSYTTIDQNTSAGRLLLVLPQPSVLGLAIGIEFYVAYSGHASNANNLQVFAYDPVTLTAFTVHSFAATSATPSWTSYPDFGGNKANWQIAGDGVTSPGATIGVAMTFAAGTTNQAKINALGVVFNYRPQRSLAVPSSLYFNGQGVAPVDEALVQRYYDAGAPFVTKRQAVYAGVAGQFYGHIEGWADTGGGTYTGTASALIQRPPDIAHHLLVTYGGLSSSDIETGSTSFGSFVKARSFLRGGAASDYVLACHIGQKSSVQSVAQQIAQQSLSLLYQDSTDGKWKWITWDADKPVDYDVILDRASVIGRIRQEPYSDVNVRQSINVPFYYDHFRGRSMFETKVGPAISTRGYNQPTYQDQQPLVVDATNNKIDWTTSGTPYTETLASGTYATPIDLAAQVQTQLRVHGTVNRVGWGFSIKAGHNANIGVRVPTGGGGVNYVPTMTAGEYGPETLAAEATRALNAAGTGRTFTVTYSHTTNLFTVSATGGSFDIRGVGGTDADVRGWAALGFDEDYTAITSQVAQQPRYAETFWINSGIGTSVFLFRWLSGANTAVGAHMLLGFAVADTTTAQDQSASFRRNNRESRAQDSADTWGELEELTLPSSYIRQEETAVLYRDRNADLRRQPKMKIEFDTLRMMDAQRGRVFATSADLDDLDPFARYGSDGSWAGKKFMIIERVSRGGTNWHDTIVAIEVTNEAA